MSEGMRPRELLEALNSNKVDVVLIGGLAAALHGTTRVTQDIDVAYASHHENLERLCQVMNALHPHVIGFGGKLSPVELTPAKLKEGPVIHLATDAGRVDLLNSVDGFNSYAAVKKLSEPHELGDGQTATVLSIDGLLKAKRFLTRAKDAQDIAELEAIAAARRIEAVTE
jgi:hypothetical protein